VEKAVIIPTGTEIIDGTVLDTNSPAIMNSLLRREPLCEIHRCTPVPDDLDAICGAVETWVEGVELVVIIGGSGGGHRFSSTLSEDHTHNALESLLDEKVSREIWGKNGHLWCKLVCGKKNGTLVINVPGPHVEAKAAIEAFCGAYTTNPSGLDEINIEMIQAVLSQYPASVHR
jgi:molybdopterin biosynthesis enzyme